MNIYALDRSWIFNVFSLYGREFLWLKRFLFHIFCVSDNIDAVSIRDFPSIN